jgi:hypothetical protein
MPTSALIKEDCPALFQIHRLLCYTSHPTFIIWLHTGCPLFTRLPTLHHDAVDVSNSVKLLPL